MSTAVLRSKVLVVGPPTVGKTAIVKKFASEDNKAIQAYSMTLSAEPSSKLIVNEEHNMSVEFFLYDISGSPIYEYEYIEVFRDANQFAVVFDVTRADTLKECEEWLDKIAKNAGKSLPGVLIGNKSDLSEFADLSADDCNNFAKERGLTYFEVSAKTGANISDPFSYLAERFIELYESEVDVFVHSD